MMTDGTTEQTEGQRVLRAIVSARSKLNALKMLATHIIVPLSWKPHFDEATMLPEVMAWLDREGNQLIVMNTTLLFGDVQEPVAGGVRTL